MAVIAPLRSAVIHCAARRRPFSAASMALLGYCSEAQAKAYATNLVKEGVLRRVADERFEAADTFDTWRLQRPRTKPGGHRVRPYRALASR